MPKSGSLFQTIPKRGVLRLQVVISRRNGQTENYQYDTLWETLQ
ncbi:hypothetical protein [Pseudomonas anguilliseptica]